MLSSPTRPFVRSMLGEQANSQHRSTPSAGFGTGRRPGAGGDKRYLGKFQQEDKFGTQRPQARVAVGARSDPARRRPARRKPPRTVADASEEALTAAVHKVMMASGADAPAVLLRVMSRLQPPVQEADESAAAGPAPSASRPDLA